MSYSQDIRSTGHHQEQFGRLRRRINKAELPHDELESLQGHVNDIRTQIDWLESLQIEDNIHTNPIGPNDFVFEPDNTEVMMYNTFANIFTYKLADRLGTATFADKVLGNAYNILEIGDGAATRSTVTPSTYHYEGWKKFNGAGDFIAIPSVTSIADLPQFSVACWFRTIKHRIPIPDSDGEGFMIGKGGWLSGAAGQNLSYGLWHSDADHLRGGFEEADSTDHIVTTTGTKINDGLWHHACVTYDGITVRLYLDGSQFGTHATTATPEVNSQDLTIGRNPLQGPNNSPLYYEGDLDQIYLWNNDLTSGEVSALYSSGTVPQASAIVKQLRFGESGDGKTQRRCFYAIPDGTTNWEYNVAFHPPQLKAMNSISLNVGSNTGQFLYYDNFATDYDFTANNASFGFWIYSTDLTNTGVNKTVMVRQVDSNNWIRIEIATDSKLFGSYRVGGTSSKRQFDTALSIDTWYYISGTLTFSGPTLSLKVNDLADTSSTKNEGGYTPPDSKIYFGNSPASDLGRSFKGYLCFPHWYKHSTVLTTAERTSLYNYGTRTSTTEPGILGFMQLG